MIILFGAAGSGKSVQGRRLAKKHGWKWLSVGQLLRDKKDAALAETMAKGELVSDELVVQMMHEASFAAHEARQKVILDGYPRDEWQAQWIAEKGDVEKIRGAIILDVPEEELFRRLQKRGRADDTREAIEKRWQIFAETIEKMSTTLTGAGVKIVKIDGTGKVSVVAARIEKILEEWEML